VQSPHPPVRVGGFGPGACASPEKVAALGCQSATDLTALQVTLRVAELREEISRPLPVETACMFDDEQILARCSSRCYAVPHVVQATWG